MDEKLNRQIYKDLIDLYKEITEVYHPTRFKQMLFRYSGDGETIVNKLAKKNDTMVLKSLVKEIN